MKTIEDPLTGRTPAEVPLKDAPLVRVLAQIRFPPITSIERAEFIAPFQEAIRATYPVLRPERTQGFLFVGEGPPSHTTPTQVVWRFHDAASAWRVSLAPEFLAIETTEYKSRTDLLARLEVIVMALATHVGPQTVDRFGLRYIDRVRDVDVAKIGELVRPEVLGVLRTPVAGNLQYSLNESLLQVPGTTSQMRVRWALLPKQTTIDAAALEPIDVPSWVLDIDMFSMNSRVFTPAAILEEARSSAERIYSVFRWAVTPRFLQEYGGKT